MEPWLGSTGLDRHNATSFVRDTEGRNSSAGNKSYQRANDHVAACFAVRKKIVTSLPKQVHPPAANTSERNSRCDSHSRVSPRPAFLRNSHEIERPVRAAAAKREIILRCTPPARDHQGIQDKVARLR